MPALERLELLSVSLAPSELFSAAVVSEAPRLRSLYMGPAMTPAAVRTLAASGLRRTELDLSYNSMHGAAGAALLASSMFAPRRLALNKCALDAATLAALARAPWPLEELNLAGNDFGGAEAAPALAALSRRADIRKLDLGGCRLSAASFKALVEADWPALTDLNASSSGVAFAGPRALGAAAFAGFPALEELNLSCVDLGVKGARALASGH
jgi:hypothetical protein